MVTACCRQAFGLLHWVWGHCFHLHGFSALQYTQDALVSTACPIIHGSAATHRSMLMVTCGPWRLRGLTKEFSSLLLNLVLKSVRGAFAATLCCVFSVDLGMLPNVVLRGISKKASYALQKNCMCQVIFFQA